MGPMVLLGLLLCTQLRGGECRAAGIGAGLGSLGAAGSGELRLVGGGGRCAGRVEVKHGGEWGSVCIFDFDFEDRWATVVCRQLGCGRVAKASPYAPFGQGSGRIWLQPFFCRGTEDALQECPHFGWGEHFCGHERDVGVICTDGVELRLAGGGSPCAGRVEVKLQGRWGSVGDDSWDMEDAEVVCQQLGCGSAAGAYFVLDRFDPGDGPVNMAMVDCRGFEATLWDCEIRGWGPYNISFRDFDTAVVCTGVVEPLRLVEGETRCDGWLEVATKTGAKRRVPGDLLLLRNFSKVCWELGCGELDESNAVPGNVTLRDINATEWAIMESVIITILGKTTALTEWPDELPSYLFQDQVPTYFLQWLTTAPAGVPHGTYLFCSGGCPEKGRRWWCPRQPCQRRPCVPAGSRRVRLVGSSGRCAGLVEVYWSGGWSSVCQEGWDVRDAAVVCRELGCGTALEAASSARFGAGTGPLWPYAPECSGSEEALWQCGLSERRECGRGGGAGAVCSEQLSVRLAGGRGRCRGFLEVSYNGTRGRVCANGTGPGTAGTVCRQLGCGDRGWLSAVAGPQPSRAWLAWVGCEDGSRSLWGCPSAAWHLQSCGAGGDAHVACEEDSDGTAETNATSYPEGATSAATGVPSRSTLAVAMETVPVPTIVYAVLGTLLCLTLGVLAVLLCRARARQRGAGRAADAISNAVYEELDYSAVPEYLEVPSRPVPAGSLTKGSVQKLPYYTGDSVEGSESEAAPGRATGQEASGDSGNRGHSRAGEMRGQVLPLLMCREAWPFLAASSSWPVEMLEGMAQPEPCQGCWSLPWTPVPVPEPPAWPEPGTPDGYDDALDVPEEPPAPSTGDMSEGVARQRWIRVLPTGAVPCPGRTPPAEKASQKNRSQALSSGGFSASWSNRAREKSWDSRPYLATAYSTPRMDSKGNVRSGNKPDAKAASSGKPEKPNPGPATNADKKEAPKEQPAPATATKKAGGDTAIANNHSNLKPSPAATETQEASGQSPDSDHKGNSSEESSGSFFDNMKPLIIVGGVAVAALAVVLGAALLARKK
ncbi:deleted in malignant brain tumors 1 protein-like isoform X8 [Poecile atricapillus]|uniref:deleted in malignant brain tumors 1 protein-like isoform X8 n=1 Tax=Poecile atricapillus TaxID=48891 RepID=UPI0027395093|nr:deleted in malignant brain tumors 1 protein-like isoform X8 [Poecile atricapillus]